jgi:hypothetical protein
LSEDNNWLITPLVNEIAKMSKIKKLCLKLGGIQHYNDWNEMK